MALTTVPTTTSSGTTALAPKGINIMKQGTASQVLYTVPTGRRFKGHIWTNGPSYYGKLNDNNMLVGYSASYYHINPLPIELAAGDVAKASPTASDYSHIQGIEFDV